MHTHHANRDTHAIELDSLAAGYGKQTILHDIHLAVEQGEMASIIGPNGAGKTTLFKILSGLITPSHGTVHLMGRPLASYRPRERARLIGVVPQSMECPMAFTVEQIVMLGRPPGSRLGGFSREDRTIVERAMAQTDVHDLRNRYFAQLSGGERQRVIIAMALAQQPSILLLDEATSHLDINHRLDVMQIVERLNRDERLTVLSISHDLDLAAEFFGRLILLNRGRIAADGAPQHVLTAERLSSIYGCEVGVDTSAQTGAVRIAPRLRHDTTAPGKGIQVHIIGGGGCAEPIMRRLCRANYTITCGVLNRGDTDSVTAEALGLQAALCNAFSSIDDTAWNAAAAMIGTADALVVTAVPFGPGNVRNLKLAEQALQQGKHVFLAEGIDQRDYTPDASATTQAAQLLEAGAKPWRTLPDLLGMLPKQADSHTPAHHHADTKQAATP
jgi:iron complex transport system ATP-binding protein